MSFSYCLKDSQFPQPTGIPSTCFYKETNGQKVWFGILGDQIPAQGDTITISLFGKTYDHYANGSTIPISQQPTALDNMNIVKIPPTTKVELYSDEFCNTGNLLSTLGGDFLKYYDDPGFDGYGEVTLTGPGASQVGCIKLTQYEDWSVFVNACQNGDTPQNICQQYASGTDQGSETGPDNTDPPIPPTDTGDDDLVPTADRGYLYTFIGVGLLLIIIIVGVCLFARSRHIKQANNSNTSNKSNKLPNKKEPAPKPRKDNRYLDEQRSRLSGPNERGGNSNYTMKVPDRTVRPEAPVRGNSMEFPERSSRLPQNETELYGVQRGLEPKPANLRSQPVPYRQSQASAPPKSLFESYEYYDVPTNTPPSRPPPIPPRGPVGVQLQSPSINMRYTNPIQEIPNSTIQIPTSSGSYFTSF